jgi:putative ABC transport system substrate-binding protein
MKCLVGSSIAVCLFLIGTAFADVAILKTAGSSQFDEVRNGFASICFENQREFSLAGDLSNQTQLTDQIRTGNYKLILSIGSQAATIAKRYLSPIQLLYCVVAFPERLGLVGENISGIPLQVSFQEQFGLIRNINKKLKRIGVIYTRPVNEPLVQNARSWAEPRGFSVISFPIASRNDLERAMTNLVGKCDVLWIPPDPTLESDDVIEYIGATSLARQIPSIGPNERYVKAGAIFSITVDAVEIGRLAGDLANKILQGNAPSKLSGLEPGKPRFILNIRSANILGLSIPKQFQRISRIRRTSFINKLQKQIRSKNPPRT